MLASILARIINLQSILSIFQFDGILLLSVHPINEYSPYKILVVLIISDFLNVHTKKNMTKWSSLYQRSSHE